MSNDHFSTSDLCGHPIYLHHKEYTIDERGVKVYDKWRYIDTNELIDDAPKRKCPKCKKFPTADGHDPCIANMSGVKAACCGPGKGVAYVMFENGRTIRGEFDPPKQ